MCVTDGHRTLCKCKLCNRARRKIRIKWYINNFWTGLKLIFKRAPDRKVVHIRISEIFHQYHYDLADPNYEWAILKDSIETEGITEPVHIQRIRDLDPYTPIIENHWMEHIANKRYYGVVDGNHRVAVAAFLAMGDPLATIPCVVIEHMKYHSLSDGYLDERHSTNDYSYFTAFHTPDTWFKNTEYGEIVERNRNLRNTEKATRSLDSNGNDIYCDETD